MRSAAHYPSMLQSTGWQISQQEDLTDAFLASVERMIAAEEKQSESLRALRGDAANETAKANLRSRRQQAQRSGHHQNICASFPYPHPIHHWVKPQHPAPYEGLRARLRQTDY